MGLDLELNLIVRKKFDTKSILIKPIAYWRNHYKLRDKLVEIFEQKEENIVERDNDYRIVVNNPIDCLGEIICFISKTIPDKFHDIYRDSIWGQHIARLQTISNLESICKWDGILFEIISSACLQVIEDLFDDENSKDFFDFNNNELIDNLEFLLELINSY